jgi:hypothetical protein
MDLSFGKSVIVAPDTLINIIGDEAVLLNLGTEQYFGLDETGASIWQAVTAAQTIQAAYERLLEQYEVDPAELRKDMSELIAKLVANGLVELR